MAVLEPQRFLQQQQLCVCVCLSPGVPLVKLRRTVQAYSLAWGWKWSSLLALEGQPFPRPNRDSLG